MISKKTLKIIIDIMMTFLLLALMGYQFFGDVAHEWLGVIMLILFILHHFLNIHWIKNIFKGKYSSYRIAQLVVDIFVLFSMLGLMISGIMLSQHVFFFIHSYNLSFFRLLHMVSAYWGFVLMAIHFGLHWNIFIRMIQKNKKSVSIAWIRIVFIVISVYGLYAFLSRNLLSYMFLRTQFVFLNYGESIFGFYLDYLAIVCVFMTLSYLFERIVLRRKNIFKKNLSKELD